MMKIMLTAHAENINAKRNAFSNAGKAKVGELSPEQRNAYNSLKQRRGNSAANQYLKTIGRANAFKNA